MLNYSLEVFYSPTLLQLYYMTVLIMFVVNTVLFVFISYAIIFHGMILEVYRWLLLIIFILSYIIDFVLASAHFVPLLPPIIIYFDGIIGRFFDTKLMAGVLLSTIALKFVVILVVIMYRYSMTTTGRLQEFFQTPTNLWGISLAHMFLGCSPMLILILDTEVCERNYFIWGEETWKGKPYWPIAVKSDKGSFMLWKNLCFCSVVSKKY
jgi:hypothetical protein